MKIPVDEAPAGAALDAAVAEAMGWRVLSDDNIGSRLAWETPEGDVKSWDFTSYGRWRPSADIAKAWMLLENLRSEDNKHISVTLPIGDSCEIRVREIVSLGLSQGFRTNGDFPLAASRAFLKAHGVTEIEVPDDA